MWSTIGGGLMGFISKTFTMRMELQAAERKHMVDKLSANQQAVNQQIENEIKLLEAKAKFESDVARHDPHRSGFRRVVALTVLFVAGFLIPAAVIFGDVSWFHLHEYTQSSNGFFGIGAYSKQVIEVISSHGLPLIFASEFLAFAGMVVGWYMGGSYAKVRNPFIK